MFFLINLILFLLGTFMDMASTILICTPLFLPLAIQMGMGPVQFGMVMLLNCALGLNTPPVGTTQFVGCAIGEISVEQVMKTILPFYSALFAVMVVVTYVPGFSTWIPACSRGSRCCEPAQVLIAIPSGLGVADTPAKPTAASHGE